MLETVDVTERLELAVKLQRDRLAELQVRKRIREDVQSGADQQQREYFLRKQMESIQRELGEDSANVVEEYRTKIDEAGMPEDVREQADKELGRLERMGEQSGEAGMIRTYLDWLIAVPWDEALRGEARSRARARGARRRPRRPRGRQGPHHRVPGRAQAADGPRHRGGQEVRRDPDPDRPARHRQDLDRRVDRPRDRTRVRPHVARRRPRRGRDPRPPADLHRRAAGPPGARPARRGDDEPGDHARRGRQGRRGLAGRPVVGAARGPGPGAEPLVPRPLPRRRARPLAGHVHRDRQRGGDDPRPAAGPHGGHPLRRLHRRGEDRDRARLPVAAPASSATDCARTRSRSPTSCCSSIVSEYTREAGVRQLERELGTMLRKTATQIASAKVEAPVVARRSSRSATRSAARRSSRRRRRARRCRAWPPAWRSPAPAATCCSSRPRP